MKRMGARYLSRRTQYLTGVPAGISFPKFMKPGQIREVKRRKKEEPHRGWREIIDEVILEASLTDPVAEDLLAVM